MLPRDHKLDCQAVLVGLRLCICPSSPANQQVVALPDSLLGQLVSSMDEDQQPPDRPQQNRVLGKTKRLQVNPCR